MTIEQLKSKISTLAEQEDIQVQAVWDKYLFDRFLIRLSKSPYKDDFVMKGGFLLEYMVGIKHRSTLDLDFSYRNGDINIEILTMKIQAILQQTQDLLQFGIKDMTPIANKGTSGYRVRIKARIGNIRKTFGIDIASGDAITPSPVNLKYVTTVTHETILIKSYNLETMLAEKFQTVIDRHTLNTRMKDYYDIYLLVNHQDLDTSLCHEVLSNTFQKRKTKFVKGELEIILQKIQTSAIIKKMYQNFCKQNAFAKDTDYFMVMEALQKVYRLIKF